MKVMTKHRTSITINKDVYGAVKNEAERQRRSFSAMVEVLCSEYFRMSCKTKGEDESDR